MEIIVFFYMAISYMIAWAIFSPFAAIEDLRQWSFAKLETVDLLALVLPFSLGLATATFVAKETFSLQTAALLLTGISIVAGSGLVLGLFLLAKMKSTTSAKRMAMIGIVLPVGFTLTIAWIGLPLYGFGQSLLLAIPATLAIGLIALTLRGLSLWICSAIN